MASALPRSESIGLLLLGSPKINCNSNQNTLRDSAEELVARILVAADKINSTPSLCQRVCHSFIRRCQLCKKIHELYFKQLMRGDSLAYFSSILFSLISVTCDCYCTEFSDLINVFRP
ncbi:hypothetical protein AVEN_225488-1 [Araneus ventricosus]|uniref:Uncharacterized protein n=1 Tax=Araneus ventricosus TaxID=182803 RepID=A0A4Y2KSU6_ARAVE|nr:hypothetical protein AVEN_225488-1 [Araneus ventricosus]